MNELPNVRNGWKADIASKVVLVQDEGAKEGEMPLFLMAFAQAISAAPPQTIDLTIRQPCSSQRFESEVVVCANRGKSNPYRVSQPPPPEAQLPKAEMQLAGGVSA